MGNGARAFPSLVVRVAPGADPTNTALTEIYEPPFPAYGRRGGDIDRNGVFWASFSSAVTSGAFDRAAQGPLERAAGARPALPGGLDALPLPRAAVPRRARRQRRGELLRLGGLVQHLGLGENVPIATANMSEAYFALVDGKFVTLRVPYPQGFFAKWAEGRIDDPVAGWRGRGLWATYSTRTVFQRGRHRTAARGQVPAPQLGLLLLEREQAFFLEKPQA